MDQTLAAMLLLCRRAGLEAKLPREELGEEWLLTVVRTAWGMLTWWLECGQS